MKTHYCMRHCFVSKHYPPLPWPFTNSQPSNHNCSLPYSACCLIKTRKGRASSSLAISYSAFSLRISPLLPPLICPLVPAPYFPTYAIRPSPKQPSHQAGLQKCISPGHIESGVKKWSMLLRRFFGYSSTTSISSPTLQAQSKLHLRAIQQITSHVSGPQCPQRRMWVALSGKQLTTLPRTWIYLTASSQPYLHAKNGTVSGWSFETADLKNAWASA